MTTIITDCEVFLLAEPKFHDHPKYVLPPGGTDAERLMATGGKVCYDTYGPDGNPVDKHVQNLVGQQHFSVLEHAVVSVFIEGVSRGLSHELVRHRHLSPSQRSTRYTAEDGAGIVLEPLYAQLYKKYELDVQSERMPQNEQESNEFRLIMDFIDQAEQAIDSYRHQVEVLGRLAPPDLSARDKRKWCRGKARQLLPHALETRLVMTGNMRSWREFFIKRTSRHAEPEIRRLAEKLYWLILPVAPSCFFHLKHATVNDYLEVSE